MNEHEHQQNQQPSNSGHTGRRFWSGFGAGIGTILLLALGMIVLIAVICAVAMSRGCMMGGDMMDREMMGQVQDMTPARSSSAGAVIKSSR